MPKKRDKVDDRPKSPRSPRFSLPFSSKKPAVAEPTTALPPPPPQPEQQGFAISQPAGPSSDDAAGSRAAASIQAIFRGRKSRASHRVVPKTQKRDASQAAAATRVQSCFRGKQVRKQRGFMTIDEMPSLAINAISSTARAVSGGISNSARGMGDFTKRQMLTRVQRLVDVRMTSLWERKFKPNSLTSDPRMPWFMRVAIHEIGDFVWENLLEEVLRTFDKMMESDLDELDGKHDQSGESDPTGLPSSGDGAVGSAATSVGKGVRSAVVDPVGTAKTSASAVGSVLQVAGETVRDGSVTLAKGTVELVTNPVRVIGSTTEVAVKGTGQLVGAGAGVVTGLVQLTKADLEAKSKPLGNCDEVLSADTERLTPKAERLAYAFEISWPRRTLGLLCKLAYWVRADFIRTTVVVDVRRANSIVNADLTDMSDPWCKVTLGRRTKRTRVIQNSLDPVWNERFLFQDTLSDVVATSLQLQLYDEDALSHELLGDVRLDPHFLFHLVADCAIMGAAQRKCFDLSLSTEGTVSVDIEVQEVSVMSWREALPLMFAFPLDCAKMIVGEVPRTVFAILTEIATLPLRAKEIRRNASRVNVTLTVERATSLLNADDVGMSDPYVAGSLCGAAFFTQTIQDSLDPVWEEEFHFAGLAVGKLVAQPLWLEVFDEDYLKRDDSIGHAALQPADLDKLIEEVRVQGPIDRPRKFELPLSTQGHLRFTLTVSELETPSWWAVITTAVGPLLDNVRAFILYHRVPYDRGTWSKLRDWRAILVLTIASSTNVFVRGAFFTGYLLSVMRELEEYQVTRFILALKGFQFISGSISLMEDMFGFWSCTVMSEDGAGCITRGPAVTTDVLQSILLLCYLQLLLAFAVTLLPFTGNYQTKTGVVKYERRNKLWAEATMMLAREESKHLGHSFVRQLPKAAQRLGIMDASDVEYSHLDSDLKVRRSELFADSVPLYTRARRALWILHYPNRAKRTDELSRNRLVTLVRYDHYAFMLAGVLFLTLAFQAASLEERIDAKAESATRCQQRGLCAPLREWTLHRLLWIAWYFVLGGALQSWRARLSFGITKLFFSLSAAPFFPLTISVINKLFTHADPTAYTADGRLTRMDSVGLAAYLVFLRDDVVYSSRFQVEFETDFAASEVERLKAAIVEGQAYLDALWENPIGNIPKRCAKKKKRVEAVVKSVITRQTASDTLYRTVFPNEVLVEEYVAAKAKRKAAAAAREKESAELTRSSTSFRNRKARESAE